MDKNNNKNFAERINTLAKRINTLEVEMGRLKASVKRLEAKWKRDWCGEEEGKYGPPEGE